MGRYDTRRNKEGTKGRKKRVRVGKETGRKREK